MPTRAPKRPAPPKTRRATPGNKNGGNPARRIGAGARTRGPDERREERLDASLEATFPASDPVPISPGSD